MELNTALKAKMKQGWIDYHGPVDDEGYIPDAPPAYDRGFRDGFKAAGQMYLQPGKGGFWK